MTSPKKRGRARRHVERTMDDAFAALESGEHALAEKLSRRAAEEGHVNPRIWHDRARIATALGDVLFDGVRTPASLPAPRPSPRRRRAR